jgi:hypothetical protein
MIIIYLLNHILTFIAEVEKISLGIIFVMIHLLFIALIILTIEMLDNNYKKDNKNDK